MLMSFRSVLVIAGAALCVTAPSLSAQTAQPAPKPRDFYGAIECAAVFKLVGARNYEIKKAAAIALTLTPANVKADEASLARMIDREVAAITGDDPYSQPMDDAEIDALDEECMRWVNSQPMPPQQPVAKPKG
jgi:hypothetical protein